MKRIKFIFAWYDIWIGIFIDSKKKLIYIFPVPCLGLVISYCSHSGEPYYDNHKLKCRQCAGIIKDYHVINKP